MTSQSKTPRRIFTLLKLASSLLVIFLLLPGSFHSFLFLRDILSLNFWLLPVLFWLPILPLLPVLFSGFLFFRDILSQFLASSGSFPASLFFRDIPIIISASSGSFPGFLFFRDIPYHLISGSSSLTLCSFPGFLFFCDIPIHLISGFFRFLFLASFFYSLSLIFLSLSSVTGPFSGFSVISYGFLSCSFPGFLFFHDIPILNFWLLPVIFLASYSSVIFLASYSSVTSLSLISGFFRFFSGFLFLFFRSFFSGFPILRNIPIHLISGFFQFLSGFLFFPPSLFLASSAFSVSFLASYSSVTSLSLNFFASLVSFLASYSSLLWVLFLTYSSVTSLSNFFPSGCFLASYSSVLLVLFCFPILPCSPYHLISGFFRFFPGFLFFLTSLSLNFWLPSASSGYFVRFLFFEYLHVTFGRKEFIFCFLFFLEYDPYHLQEKLLWVFFSLVENSSLTSLSLISDGYSRFVFLASYSSVTSRSLEDFQFFSVSFFCWLVPI
ncbi:unnamed protein product [Acanthosepion pharaonis]|uniref:Uncharacterized protein n=1 Tax=Acanthosepion pharaonis TaxID=158019 RepID=A0A812CU73_ACAPH|nr:unnamed protein product [Sepia pharaonis]